MRLYPKIKSAVLYTLLTICWFGSLNAVFCQEDSTKTVKKEESTFKKDLTAIEKLLSFKNFFHNDNPAALARKYVRRHKKILRRKYDYRNSINKNGPSAGPYKRINSNKLNYEVLGWYPSWDKDLHKNLNYSLLKTIAYFSYELDPHTGNPKTIHDWETTPVIDSAKVHGNNVLLTVTNFGNSNNRKFLKNNSAVLTLIDQIKQLLKKQNAQGVCIDFEGVLKSQKNDFSSFITLLNQELKKVNKDYLIYLTVPAVDWEKYLDFEVLIPIVDQFAIMGYDYYGISSKAAGPVAPLNSGKIWDPYNLTTSVDFYLANKVPPSQLILALPFYGYIWNTKSGERGSKVEKNIGPRTFDYIKTEMTNANATARYDSISQSVWYSYIIDDNGKNQFRQCWVDSEYSMSAKLDLIKNKGINGMGIWALGYDKGYPDFWRAIEVSFCRVTPPPNRNESEGHTGDTKGNTDGSEREPDINTDTSATTPPKDTPPGTPPEEQSFLSKISAMLTDLEGLLEKISDYKSLLIFAMAFVVLFGGAGFIISMFKSNTRMFFFGNNAFTVYYTAIVLIFLLVILRWKNIIVERSTALIVGFIVGAIALYFISKTITKIHKDLP